MPEQGQGKVLPRGFKAALIALALAWIAVLVILSRVHGTRQGREPQAILPVYPSAYETDVRSVPERDWRSANYLVPLDYPALDVFTYYDDRMTEQGWSRLGVAAPEWQVSGAEGGKHATLAATWIAPQQLARLDLQLAWEQRKPTAEESSPAPQMRVTAVMSRNYVPLEMPQASEKKGKGEAPFAK